MRPQGTEPKTLDSLLAASGKSVVQGFLDTCLLPREAIDQRLTDSGVQALFLDPGLRRTERSYHRVIQRMNQASMLGYQFEAPKERIGFFAVAKKNGR